MSHPRPKGWRAAFLDVNAESKCLATRMAFAKSSASAQGAVDSQRSTRAVLRALRIERPEDKMRQRARSASHESGAQLSIITP